MRVLTCLVTFTIAAALAGLGAAASDEPPLNLTPAVAAAERWLATLDSGRYTDTWEEAATIFKDGAPRSFWEPAVQAARQPLGGVIARKVRSMRYVNALPNAPPGHYVIIEFDTHFEKRPLSVETVTPMRTKAGDWKVAGYFIR
ncbi:MAG: DUF4019 domain-containing protein [Usitatibacter sp.]